MTSWRWIAAGIVMGCIGAGVAGLPPIDVATVSAQTTTRVFELRTYTANPGKFEAMKARFETTSFRCSRSTISRSSGSGRMPMSRSPRTRYVYILAFQSREAAQKNWEVFRADRPEEGVGGD